MSKKYYDQYFGSFIIMHVLCWTLVPILLRHNIYLDTMEAIAWGHEWQAGYVKHPPLSAWFSELIILISNKQVWTLYLVSQLCIALSFVAVWKLAKLFLKNELQAFLATILLEGIYYYNFTSIEFNPNVLMMPLFAWFIYFAWQIFAQNKLQDWLALAVISALGFLTKYNFVILIFCFFLFLLYEKRLFKILTTKAPYIATLLFLALITPNILWLIKNDFAPIKYLQMSSNTIEYSLFNHVKFPFKFSLSQLFAISFALLLFFTSFTVSNLPSLKEIKKDKTAVFLIFMGLMPFFLSIAPSLISGGKMKDMWGTPLWNLVGILLFYFYKPKISDKSLKYFYIKLGVVVVIALIVYAVVSIQNTYAYFDGKSISKRINESWNKNHAQPLEIVAGDVWIAGNIALYSAQRPRVFIDFDEKSAPWMSYDEFNKKGGIIVWNADIEGEKIPQYFREKITVKLLEQKPIEITAINNGPIKIKLLGWAIVEPK